MQTGHHSLERPHQGVGRHQEVGHRQEHQEHHQEHQEHHQEHQERHHQEEHHHQQGQEHHRLQAQVMEEEMMGETAMEEVMVARQCLIYLGMTEEVVGVEMELNRQELLRHNPD